MLFGARRYLRTWLLLLLLLLLTVDDHSVVDDDDLMKCRTMPLSTNLIEYEHSALVHSGAWCWFSTERQRPFTLWRFSTNRRSVDAYCCRVVNAFSHVCLSVWTDAYSRDCCSAGVSGAVALLCTVVLIDFSSIDSRRRRTAWLLLQSNTCLSVSLCCAAAAAAAVLIDCRE